MEAGKVAGDYLLLTYSGEDKLYLPVDRLNLVQRYKGPEGADPSLDKLGGPAWKRAKDKAKKAIEKIAAELVEMYAYRQVAKGYAYDPVDDMYREFEASFGFEETPDQERAISDVLEDMEKPAPMDRLVCGDVGFGKTEVAMRAAMRAALNGKQSAILCPTTVLAEQHYHTFTRRLADFPVTVGMISRFVPRARQKEILAAAERGEIDILIGTHRLLSGDVSLPNLGLMVLDEEQRFGVKAKEKLKHFRKNIDVLALTATPIPRTLQLSLSGIRQLSVIETPPEDRKPVRTSLIERDDKALKAILEREMARGGQVFWVHNRVQGLGRVTEHVKSLAPDARIGMAHGQMRERELEETMHKFWHGELDVLVCTAIIESGLDFPRANTLIVDNAQIFGLGQLYQLRGRVGRSDRQAFAYFVIPSLKSLPETARRRLQVILEMDYLGAGFQIAREDLRIRGAGNILGEVQSGSMARVGIDLFMEMLSEEVGRIKGEQVKQATEPEMGILFDARIPEEYLPDPHDRLRYYKALSSARDDMATAELLAELKDRFGPPPEEALRFIEVLRLKRVLSKLRAERADLYPNRVVVSWNGGDGAPSPEKVVSWVSNRDEWAKLKPPAKIELRIPEKMSIREGMEYIAGELLGLMEQEDVSKVS
jgi:transcription-repair coupling factor (superfamily II helicase)